MISESFGYPTNDEVIGGSPAGGSIVIQRKTTNAAGYRRSITNP